MAHDEPDDDSCGLRLGSAREADAQAIIDMGREERVHAVSVSGQPLFFGRTLTARREPSGEAGGVGIGKALVPSKGISKLLTPPRRFRAPSQST